MQSELKEERDQQEFRRKGLVGKSVYFKVFTAWPRPKLKLCSTLTPAAAAATAAAASFIFRKYKYLNNVLFGSLLVPVKNSTL